MAGNENSGRNVRFPYSAEELKDRFEQYKADLKAGEFARPSWPHFCAYLGLTEADFTEMVKAEREAVKAGAYKAQVREVEKILTWMRGQLLSSSAWSGPASAKAIFALKQDLGDGVKYTDKPEQGQTGPVQVQVVFGDGDKRGKSAFK